MIDGWMNAGMVGRRQGRRERECGSRGPQAKYSGANLGKA